MYGKTLSRSGSKHDPPFGESIGSAMQQAMDTLNEGTLNGSFPSSIYGWSGNTHWKWPMPDYEGDPEYMENYAALEDEDIEDEYMDEEGDD